MIQGMVLTSVPCHNMVLESDLVCGTVAVGMRHALPIEGVVMILGNSLAGVGGWPTSSYGYFEALCV